MEEENLCQNLYTELFNHYQQQQQQQQPIIVATNDDDDDDDNDTERDNDLEILEKNLQKIYHIINGDDTSDEQNNIFFTLKYCLKKSVIVKFQELLEPICNLMLLKNKTKNVVIKNLINSLYFSKYNELSTLLSTFGNFLKNNNLLSLYSLIFIWFQGEFTINSQKNNKNKIYGKTHVDKIDFILPKTTPFDQYITNQLAAEHKPFIIKMPSDTINSVETIVTKYAENFLVYNFSSFIAQQKQQTLQQHMDKNVLDSTKNNIYDNYLKTLLFLEFKNKELHKLSNFYAKISIS